jgi:tellurite resistance protein TerC
MGLAIVLTFIGAKMLVVAVGIHIPIWISLVFVAVVLLGSVAASLIWAKQAGLKIDVDLPADFDSLFEDEPVENEPVEK